jgi:hypothetical protein
MSVDRDDHEAERRRSLEAYEPKSSVIRASDADRERAVAQLRQHLADGRLTMEEFSERVDEAYAARTTADIDHALRELPHVAVKDLGRARPGQPAAARQRSLQERRAFRASLVSYVAVNSLLVLIWLVTVIGSGDLQYFWPIWPILGWGIGMAVHAWKVYGEPDE